MNGLVEETKSEIHSACTVCLFVLFVDEEDRGVVRDHYGGLNESQGGNGGFNEFQSSRGQHG